MASANGMRERIAVVGSRRGADLEKVQAFLHRLHSKSPDCIVVSGGADGVDSTAETTWLGLGGRVISLRPYEMTPEKFIVQELRLSPLYSRLQPEVKLLTEPSWDSYAGACFWRNKLIVQRCDRLVYFMAEPPTRGTSDSIDAARAEGKPYYDGSSILYDGAAIMSAEEEDLKTYAWGNNPRRAELKGRKCRVLAEGAKNSILLEFPDTGEQVVTSRRSVR